MTDRPATDTRRPVVAVFHHFPPFPGAGAIRAEHFARELAKRQPTADDLVVLTTVVGPLPAGLGKTYRVVSLGDDPVENRRSLASRAFGEVILGLKASWRALRLRPRIVVISSPGYIVAMIVALAMSLFRIRYVLDVRDIYPEVYAGAGLMTRDSIPFRLLSGLSRWAYSHAVSVAAATEGLSRTIRSQAPSAKVQVIYNGFPKALRTRSHVEKLDRFTCSFHGVLGFYQDAATLLAVARALQPHGIDVRVIGYGRGEEILTQNPPPNLKVMGRLPFPETIALVERTHVGLCLRTDDPISRDAMPVKMFEYLGLNVPTLVTPPSEAGAFVERHQFGRAFESGDIEGLTAEVLRLRDDPAYLAARVEACAAVDQEFTREVQAARFAEMVADADRASCPNQSLA